MTVKEGLSSLASTEEILYSRMNGAIAQWAQYGMTLTGVETAVSTRRPEQIISRVNACLACNGTGDLNIVNPYGDVAMLLRSIRDMAKRVIRCEELSARILAYGILTYGKETES